MVELLRYLEANGFTTFIASGGDRDFMRPIAATIYGIPPERVIGSSSGARARATATARRYKAGHRLLRRRAREAGADLEPHRAAADARRRQLQRRHPDAPVRSVGPALRLLVLHDDAEREFDYTGGAEDALERAERLDGDQREGRLGDRLRVSRLVPAWLRSYQRAWLRPDLSPG